MALANRIYEALWHLENGQLESATINIAIAIDATARRHSSSDAAVGNRFRSLIDQNEDFIVFVGLGCQAQLFVTGTLSFATRGKLSNVLYKFVRNPLIHEADASAHVEFSEQLTIGHHGNKFVLTKAMLYGLALVLIGDSANGSEIFPTDLTIEIGAKELRLNNLWGRLSEIKTRLGFRELRANSTPST